MDSDSLQVTRYKVLDHYAPLIYHILHEKEHATILTARAFEIMALFCFLTLQSMARDNKRLSIARRYLHIISTSWKVSRTQKHALNSPDIALDSLDLIILSVHGTRYAITWRSIQAHV